MPRSTWLVVAALATVLVLLFVVDPMGLFDAGSGDGPGPGDLPEDFLDGPGLEGLGARDGSVEITEFDGDPVGVLDLRMGAGRLTGVVTGEDQPLELARVRPVLPPPFTNLAVRTRRDGTWELQGLPLAQHEIRVRKEGWVSKTVVSALGWR